MLHVPRQSEQPNDSHDSPAVSYIPTFLSVGMTASTLEARLLGKRADGRRISRGSAGTTWHDHLSISWAATPGTCSFAS